MHLTDLGYGGVTSSAKSQSGLARMLASLPLVFVLGPLAVVAGYDSARCCRTPRKVSGAPRSTLEISTQIMQGWVDQDFIKFQLLGSAVGKILNRR